MPAPLSSLTASANCTNADLFYVVQGGTSFKTDRTKMLTVAGVDTFGFSGTGFFLGVNGSGDVAAIVPAGQSFTLGVGGITHLGVDPSGNSDMRVPVGAHWSAQANGAQLTMDASGNVIISCPGGAAVTILGFAGSSSDWSGDPTDVWSAIYRIAAAVASGTSGPIA